ELAGEATPVGRQQRGDRPRVRRGARGGSRRRKDPRRRRRRVPAAVRRARASRRRGAGAGAATGAAVSVRAPGQQSHLRRIDVQRLALWLVVLLAFALGAVGLNRAPIYLHEAEILFALHAHAIATTGHDLYGRLLPLYFEMRPIGANVWFHPAL